MPRLHRVSWLLCLPCCACFFAPSGSPQADTTGTGTGTDTGTDTTLATSEPTTDTPTTSGTSGDLPEPPPDMDGDGFPDATDLCPSLPAAQNIADADHDGIGDECDLCRRAPADYNLPGVEAPIYLLVRNIPAQADHDRDGIGDVCDNCIVAGNCGDFGAGPGQTPIGIGDVIPFDDPQLCQIDVDGLTFIGDACIVDGMSIQLDDAGGPVGLDNTDDLDQDGLINLEDACPRLRVAAKPCTKPQDCDGADCLDGRCNHADQDNDGIGDACDTCPALANPKQVQNGGMQDDDPDGDFVGTLCEAGDCADKPNAWIGFNSASADGVCCVVLFDEQLAPRDPGLVTTGDECAVVDPAVPLRAECAPTDEGVVCRQVPAAVLTRPGVGLLPAGCVAPGTPLTLDSPGIDQDTDMLYRFMCRMPTPDRDFDGIGDACDLCPDAFDPDNTDTFCTGDYDPAVNRSSCP